MSAEIINLHPPPAPRLLTLQAVSQIIYGSDERKNVRRVRSLCERGALTWRREGGNNSKIFVVGESVEKFVDALRGTHNQS
jgi:hypothetical protein